MESLLKSQARDQRRVELKLDCVDCLTYMKWEPKKEYKKTFVVKNIATKVQTLRWEPPVSPYFEVQFQEPHARLGPMMIAAINIVFRPSALENYTSSVEFRTLRGNFTLELRGPLPFINLGIPDVMDFCYGPVNDVTEKTFMMKNTSEITVTYEWAVDLPFSIHPTRSSIQKGKSEMVYCRFQPTKAAAYSTTAVCCTYIGVAAEMKMKGIGKYSFLAVANPLLQFGDIMVRTTKEMVVVVTNISIVPAKFQVVKLENKYCKQDADNFTVIPMQGVIKPNATFHFKVIFSPVTAGNFSTENFEIHTCQTCRASFACSGTAARPIIKLSTFSLDFGSVESGGYVSRSVLLDNQSIVPVHFQFIADDMGIFEFLNSRAVCRSNRSYMITIQFRPIVIANYYKRILIIIQDQHALYVDLLGTCYRVALKSPTLMQYHVDQHRELLRTSCSEVQVASERDKANFPSRQSVLANLRPYFMATTVSSTSLKKGLNGSEWESHPGAWHAMIELPEWAEEKAGAPDDPTSPRPPPQQGRTVSFLLGTNPRQVDKFAPGAAQLTHTFFNPEAGTSPQGPRHRTSADRKELAEQLLQRESISREPGSHDMDLNFDLDDQNSDPNRIPYRRKSRLDSRYLVFSKSWQRGLEGHRNVYHHEIWDEYYIGRMEYWEPVIIDQQHLDFGLEKCMQLSEPQFLHVHNNIQTPVTVLWVSPKQPKIAEFTGIKPKVVAPKSLSKQHQDQQLALHGGKAPNIFHIVPDKAIIPIGGTYTFSVIFEPKAQNNHYCQYLQLFVWSPSIDRVLPPWSTLVCCVGNSFEIHNQEFLPEFSVSKTHINFPACLKGFSVHQTVILRNHNITIPLSFIFQLKDLLPQFIIKPEQGLIPPGDFQLITFRYDAGDLEKITNKVQCVLNHSKIDNLFFVLNGSSHLPKLLLDKNGVARFKPTSVGTRATLYIILRNASPITTEFEWQVPRRLSDAFIIKPVSGILRSSETISVSICFLPQHPKLYYCKIPCRTFAHVDKCYIKDNGMAIENVLTREINRIYLLANGEGVVETIEIEPPVVDYGVIVVGLPYKAFIVLKNLSAGSLRYELSAECADSRLKNHCIITFDRPTGQLHGHCKRKIVVEFHAKKEVPFNFDILCRTFLPKTEMPQYANLLPDSDPAKFQHFEMEMTAPVGAVATGLITGEAKFPYMVIVSLRCDGLSSPQMWRELQIRKLNSVLFDGKLRVKKSGEAMREDLFCQGHPVKTDQVFTFDFGAQIVSTNQTIIDLVIKSGNELPVSWRVRLWNDVEIDMENWVIPMEPTEEERRFMLIRKFNLFHIEPRKGYVPPGEQQFLRFRYVHLMEGKHVLPAIIEVTHGRTIHINLHGRSLPHLPKILTMNYEKHFLKPTSIGVLNPPFQTVELCNRGPCDIDFELDTTELEEMTKANFGFRVLWCRNPSGTIREHDSVLLNFMFQPLEAKHYGVQIPVHVEGGEGRMLLLEGHGVHPQDKEEFLEHLMARNEPLDMGQTYNWPDLPVILSTELIDFDSILELSENYRLVAIQSLSTDCRVQFAWHNSVGIETNVEGTFQVIPEQGIIEPGKQALCKVHFSAGYQPQKFETTIYLVAQRIPIEPEEILHIPPKRPPLPPVDVLVDTWPLRMGAGIYNKQFQHHCVIERFTATAKLHMNDNARYKLEHLEANRGLQRLEQLEKEALTFSPPPPIYTNLYLTARSSICPRIYNSTKEDLLSTEDRLPFKLPERTIDEVQLELLFGIVLELLQDGLQDEMCNQTFKTLAPIKDRILCFEDFRKPQIPTEIPAEDQLDGLPEGTLPAAPPWIKLGVPTEPLTPLATLADAENAPEAADGSEEEFVDRVRERMIAVMMKSPPPTPPQMVEDGPVARPRDEPSLRAMDMSYTLLEEILFDMVKDLFETEM